jgi:AraC-like DNA-binding protein
MGSVGGIGEYRCPPRSKAWEVENRIGDMATIAFARDPVGIAQAGCEPVVATPNEATMYNPFQAYRRRSIDGRGDRCEFFLIRTELLAEIVAAHAPGTLASGRGPLAWASAPASAEVYVSQRVLYHHVRQPGVVHPARDAASADREGTEAGASGDPGGVDGLLVDECMVNIVDALVGAASRRRPGRARRATTGRDHRVWIEGAKDYLARHYRRALTLEEVGAAVGLSVFHLCRLFKAYAGRTVHDYVRSLRVRASLELLGESAGRGSMKGPGDRGEEALAIGQIAAELGFCNPSHFTRAFKAEFGATPSEMRRALRDGAADRGLLRGKC